MAYNPFHVYLYVCMCMCLFSVHSGEKANGSLDAIIDNVDNSAITLTCKSTVSIIWCLKAFKGQIHHSHLKVHGDSVIMLLFFD